MSRSNSPGTQYGIGNAAGGGAGSSSASAAAAPPPLMSINAHLQCSVEQCLDSICFSGTHLIDADLRAQPRASQASIDRLVTEQLRRLDENFGPRTLSSDIHANILDELFRIDSCSISDRPDENGQLSSSVVEIMTDTTAKIFKKEMKQRIHDWEGAFRDTFGREPTPQDKNRLKHIYELYKIVKNRVVRGAAAGQQGSSNEPAASTTPTKHAPPPPPPPASSSTSGGGGQQPRAPSPLAVGTLQQQSTPVRPGGGSVSALPSPSMTPMPNNSNAPTTSSSHQQQQGAASYGGGNTPMVALTPMGASTPNAGSNTASRPQSRHATPTAAASNSNNNTSPPGVAAGSGGGGGGGGGTTPRASYDSLVNEKRTLKRKLHAFEADFAKQHGRPPTREDRLPLIQQYQRYGELKLAIQAYGSNEGGGGDD